METVVLPSFGNESLLLGFKISDANLDIRYVDVPTNQMIGLVEIPSLCIFKVAYINALAATFVYVCLYFLLVRFLYNFRVF